MNEKFKYFIFYLLRITFGLYLICFGVKNFAEISTNIKHFHKNIQNFKFLDFDLKAYSYAILVLENCALIYGGLLYLLGTKLSILFLMTGFLIEIVFIIDLSKLSDFNRLKYFLNILPLIGGVLKF